MLDAVATRMPKNPDRPEQNAPTTKDRATSWMLPLLPMTRRMATAITKIDSTLYSRLQKRHGAFAHGGADFLHALGAGILPVDPPRLVQGEQEGQCAGSYG